MKIILFDHLGCHAAVLAGSYLGGIIDLEPTAREILALPVFGFYESLLPGTSFYIGHDKLGNEIYTLGVGSEAKIMSISARDISRILGVKEHFKIIDVSAYNTPLVRLFIYIGLLKPFNRMVRYFCAQMLRGCIPELSLLLKQELKE